MSHFDQRIYGNANVVNYSMAKGGLIALSNVAALEGAAQASSPTRSCRAQ